MPRLTPEQCGGKNRAAFLDMIAYSEIGPALLAESDDGYNVLVGSTPSAPLLFHSYIDHPDVLNRQFDSTAAGRYQLLHYWWTQYKRILNLPDFSPVSQDRVALRQIQERGAFPHLDGGDFATAVRLCSNIWASLPGNDYGQHENQLAALQEAFLKAGGVVA